MKISSLFQICLKWLSPIYSECNRLLCTVWIRRIRFSVFFIFFGGISINTLREVWLHFQERGIYLTAIVAVTIFANIYVVWDEISLLFRLEKARKQTSSNEVGSERRLPPALAEWCLILVTNPRQLELLIGDLEEDFNRHCDKFGDRRARRIYWAGTLRSVRPLFLQTIKRLWTAFVAFESLKKWISH